jgi:ABC-type transport system involved in multi-copper enzyme maturation permease subunit
MWSILQRELREQSRQAGTYWLRLTGALALLALLAWVWNSPLHQLATNGRGYFVGLNRVLFLTIWLVGPVLTADCLSREKRDGTIGLLFLTPLRALDIVLGKGFVNAWRAFSVLLAALPVLVVPVLMGGVSWADATRMVLLHLGALGLALAAGLLASSYATSWVRARLLAFGLAVIAGAVFILLHVALSATLQALTPGAAGSASWWELFGRSFQTLRFRNSVFLRTPTYFWREIGIVGNSGWEPVRFAALLAGGALLLVAAAMAVAERGVRLTWQAVPRSPAWERRVRFFTDVRVSRGWFRGCMSRLMDFNPVWWRHSSTWSARVTTLSWLGLTMLLLTAAYTGLGIGAVQANGALEKLLLTGLAFSAAGSFRQERETGALELVLVTGLEPARMLRGRLYALAVQFLPAALLVWGLPPVVAHLHREPVRLMQAWEIVWLLPTALLGLSLSLNRPGFFTAFVAAAGAHHVVAALREGLTALLFNTGLIAVANAGLPHPHTLIPSLQAALAVGELFMIALVCRWAWKRAVLSVEKRSFLVSASKPNPSPSP